MPNARPPHPENLTPEQQAQRRVAAAKKRRRREEQRRRAMRRYYAFLALLAVIVLLIIFGLFKLVQWFIHRDDAPSSGTSSSAVVGQNGSSSASTGSGADSAGSSSGDSSSVPASSAEPQPTAAPADKNAWNLLLANVQNPLPEGYVPGELVEIGSNARNGTMYVDKRTEQAFLDLLNAAKADGIALVVRSAYRSHQEQTMLFNNMKQDYLNQGMSEEEALAETKKWRNVPGTSEHETGLCADIVGEADLNAELVGELSERDWAVWLKEHAADYGFILRYPEDNVDITGTSFEPWHYRYVGKEDAKNIMSQGMCLEEYLGQT